MGCSHINVALAYSKTDLTILPLGVANTNSPMVRSDQEASIYIEEQIIVLRPVSPITKRTGRSPSSPSILSSAYVRNLIMENQAKPLTSDQRWLALVNLTSAISPLTDGLISQPIS